MKQQITQEQFEQLTPAQRVAYIEWTLKQGDPAHSYRTIGDLIHFIDEHFHVGWWHVERSELRDAWRVHAKYNEGPEQPELIDALWEAVKALLESREHDNE